MTITSISLVYTLTLIGPRPSNPSVSNATDVGQFLHLAPVFAVSVTLVINVYVICFVIFCTYVIFQYLLFLWGL